jgi:hypothetical protein
MGYALIIAIVVAQRWEARRIEDDIEANCC